MKHPFFQRRSLFLLCLIFCGAFILQFYNQYQVEDMVSSSLASLKPGDTVSSSPGLDRSRFLSDDIETKFLINTIGCQIPTWDPWDDSVKHLFTKHATPYECPGHPFFLRTLPNGIVTVDETLLKFYYKVDPGNVSCVYQNIIRNTRVVDSNMDSRFSMSSPKNLRFDQPMEIDFIKAICKFSDRFNKLKAFIPLIPLKVAKAFIPLTPLKAKVEKRCVSKNSKIKVPKPLNVIFMGLDSISHLNFLRHFPKCQDYMSKFLNPITMNGYTKVGDNTFPNIVPLLTGYSYQHYYDEVYNKSMFFDDLDFSWKHFAELGYRTMFAEDAPYMAIFNYLKKGFKIPPTDYYYRLFALAMEKSEIKAKSKSHCIGSKMEIEIMYDYLKSFTDTMGLNRSFFAFVFGTRLTHDVLNFAGYADEPTYQVLKHLHESNILNNTMLVFYSDHGIRFGDIRKTRVGQYEERSPFMHLILPEWFLNEHKGIHHNLKINSYRLTTPFDIHATVRHLASLMSGETKFDFKLKPGMSLFREIPSSRTCQDAEIAPHWCTCQVPKTISKQKSIEQKAADTVIETINSLTSAYKGCAILTLDKILDVRVTDSGRMSLNNLTQNIKGNPSFINYLIVISVNPSKAIFEATVRCGTTQESPYVVDDISRINKYGTQSDCISVHVIEKFCYCL